MPSSCIEFLREAINWWDLVPAVIGAGFGAAASAIPSYCLANKASKEMLARDSENRRSALKAATIRGMIKLMKIVNGYESLFRHTEEMISRVPLEERGEFRLWQIMTPIAGIDASSVSFDAQELEVFIEKGEGGFASDLLLLAERYNTITSAMIEYGRIRTALTDQMPPEDMQGARGISVLDPAKEKILAPKVVEVSLLAFQVRATLKSDYAFSLQLGEKFGVKARSLLRDSEFPVLSLAKAKASLEKDLSVWKEMS